jgi:hypothetical protein
MAPNWVIGAMPHVNGWLRVGIGCGEHMSTPWALVPSIVRHCGHVFTLE